MTTEDTILKLVKDQYGTVSAFAKASGIPNSTLATILHRSVYCANFMTVVKLCNALQLDLTALANGEVVQRIKF